MSAATRAIRILMPEGALSAKDDRLTVTAVSVLACILQDVLHEGLGHGVTAGLSGARRVTMSTVALQSDIDTPWIAANGTLVNLFFAGIVWLLLLKPRRYKSTISISSCSQWRAIYLRAQATSSFQELPTLVLGGGDSRSATALDMAAWANVAWRCLVLCVDVGGGEQTKAISRQG